MEKTELEYVKRSLIELKNRINSVEYRESQISKELIEVNANLQVIQEYLYEVLTRLSHPLKVEVNER